MGDGGEGVCHNFESSRVREVSLFLSSPSVRTNRHFFRCICLFFTPVGSGLPTLLGCPISVRGQICAYKCRPLIDRFITEAFLDLGCSRCSGSLWLLFLHVTIPSLSSSAVTQLYAWCQKSHFWHLQ